MNNFLQGLAYLVCSALIPNIHFWCIRKALYRLMGMKIGKHSRILRKTIVVSPRNIILKDNVYVNEYCYLDGRGGIEIGDNSSISVYSFINTGSHGINDADFPYTKQKVVIGKNVFIGAHGIVLAGTIVPDGTVLCAGSVMKKGKYEKNGIYFGVPALRCGERKDEATHYQLGYWKPWFR